MISNLILQDTLNGIKTITRQDLGIAELDGKVIAQTSEDLPVRKSDVISFAESKAETQENAGCLYFKVYDDSQLEYVLVVRGTGEEAEVVGKMTAFQVKNLLVAYKEHFDKDNFIKNLLLDNLLLVDIYSRAKKLHLKADVRRVVYVLESAEEKEFPLLEEVRQYFSQSRSDFITAVDEKSTIIVKELAPEDGPETLQGAARQLIGVIDPDGGRGLRISYGNIVGELKEVSRSYKEARMALDVGKIFFEGENVIAYSQLGIGRLIYQLPIPLCKMFIKEIFASKSLDEFDEATITPINQFFENNLNVSETSRQLYIHRNTLVYRLDKLQKSTGLDLRVFEDAITFKIALMVVRYMKYMETLEY